jgi:hypothetical protein
MKINQIEFVGLGLLILYIAFFSHPPPAVVQSLLANPIGQAVVLVGVLYLAAYKSMVLGLFAAVAYVLSIRPAFEYLDPKEQAPKKEEPKVSGVPSPAVTGILKDMLSMTKGDRLPQKAGKDEKFKPPTVTPPKPSMDKKVENFTPF